MSTPKQEHSEEKFTAFLSKQSPAGLVKNLKKIPDRLKRELMSAWDSIGEEQVTSMGKYLNSGKDHLINVFGLNDKNIEFKVTQSPNSSEAWPQFDVVILVSKDDVIAAELNLGKMKETLRKVFRTPSCPEENASLGKVSVEGTNSPKNQAQNIGENNNQA